MAADKPQSDRRPWEPPFDPSQPALPISYPLTNLPALLSRSYFDSFHFPFNRSSVPLPPSASAGLPPRRRILVCHDMMGGYRDDASVQGGSNPDAYAIWHWHLMDVFVYFSHYLVTLPPPCWTNVAHTHGVKVLGTFITEWGEGRIVCKTLLSTKDSARMYAERLAELAMTLGFDGWLINMEVNLDSQLIDNLREFVDHLSECMHLYVPGSLVIWYDAVTKDGDLAWQNQLNEKNKPFFDLCDGIFVNYTWTEKKAQNSAAFAGSRKYDVYMGIDVFGRNTFGGGQWNTNVALDLLKKEDVSAAIYAPGWVYETGQGPDFQSAQNRWWGLVEQSWGILQSYPNILPFYSNFDQGHGYQVSIQGVQVDNTPWNNISCQGFQPVLSNSTDPNQTSIQAFVDFKNAPYSGGGSIMIKGSIQHNTLFSTRLFRGILPLEGQPVYILYSVKSDGESVIGFSLELSSESEERTYALITNDIEIFSDVESPKNEYKKIIPAEKKVQSLDVPWTVYEAIFWSSGHILTGINMVCTSKIPGINKQKPVESRKLKSPTQPIDGLPSYCALLGHISIRMTETGEKFPPADAWITEGRHISWSSGPNATKHVSLKIIWELKAEYASRFTKYIIYVEKLTAYPADDTVNRTYLGITRVEAFYVSNLQFPDEITSLRFIIQACGHDGSYQELEESPVFTLMPAES